MINVWKHGIQRCVYFGPQKSFVVGHINIYKIFTFLEYIMQNLKSVKNLSVDQIRNEIIQLLIIKYNGRQGRNSFCIWVVRSLTDLSPLRDFSESISGSPLSRKSGAFRSVPSTFCQSFWRWEFPETLRQNSFILLTLYRCKNISISWYKIHWCIHKNQGN